MCRLFSIFRYTIASPKKEGVSHRTQSQQADKQAHLCELCKLLSICLVDDFDGHLLHVILHAFENLSKEEQIREQFAKRRADKRAVQ